MKPPILGAGPRGLSVSVFQCLPRDLVGFSVKIMMILGGHFYFFGINKYGHKIFIC